MSEDKKPKKKKKAGDIFLTIVLIAAICIFCYAAFQRIMPYDRHCKPAHKSTFKRDHRRIRPGLGS